MTMNQNPGGTAFTNAMIFDGSDGKSFPGSVLVRGQRIEAVAVGDDVPAWEGAAIIDCAGKTLMPGMVEGHAHLTWPSSIERVFTGMHVPLDEHIAVTENNARITLEAGFTSAYSAGSLGERIEPELRDRINAGVIPGPRLRASALEKGMEGVMGVPEGHDPTHDRSIDGLRAYVKAMKALGCDTIKILLSSDDGFAPGGARIVMYSEEETAAIGEAAAEADIWLACHAQNPQSIKQAVRAGFRCLFHCTYADEEALDLMEAAKDRIFYAPAAGLLWARCHEAEAFGIDAEKAALMGATSGLELMQEIIPQLRKRGIRVMPGGDYGFPYNPIGKNARDLELFVKLFGFSEADALIAATGTGGALMDMELGQIKPGYLADLLLIDGDPLADISVLQHADHLVAIMKDGRFHKAPLMH